MPDRLKAERTHVNNRCQGVDVSFEILAEACERLIGDAVEVRYPGEFYDYPLEEAKEAIKLAEKIRNLVLEKANLLE